jgi:hypothetical protein
MKSFCPWLGGYVIVNVKFNGFLARTVIYF